MIVLETIVLHLTETKKTNELGDTDYTQMFPYMWLIQAHKWIFIPSLPISVICTFRVFPVGINSQGWEKVMVSYWYSLSK